MPGIAISIIIPAYNAAATIAQTLAALQSQAGGITFETLVVDNGSSDATATIAKTCGATVLTEQKRGPAAARNCGLQAARGDIILCCDADTVPSRRWVREMARAFEQSETLLVAGNTLCYPPETAAERFVERTGLYDMERALSRPVLPFVITLNLGVRRTAALEIGGFCEDLMTAEDVDFSHRLLRAFNTKIVYRQSAVLYHHCRSDAAALARQAYTYGDGMAECYLRYPDQLSWNWRQSLLVASRLTTRRLETMICAARGALGHRDAETLEFFHYRNLWETQFFTAFFKKYYGSRKRLTPSTLGPMASAVRA